MRNGKKNIRWMMGWAISLALLPVSGQIIWAQNLSRPLCFETIGVRQLLQHDPSLTGETVQVALVELSQAGPYEDGEYAFLPYFGHEALQDVQWRSLYCYQNAYRPVYCSDHASMIAGILCGHHLDTNSATCPDGYVGIVPEAVLDVYETNWFIYKSVLGRQQEVTDPVDVLNMSWGTDAGDVITMWWQRGIDAMAQQKGAIITAACGNGADDFQSISKPSWGYNVISVGAASNLGFAGDTLGFVGAPDERISNAGPTEDGRCKPDLIAPGLCLAPAASDPESYIYSHTMKAYSSFASPQVAGVAALLIQAARRDENEAAQDPRVIKALLLNGANKLIGWHKGLCGRQDDHEVPLDYRQGAGLVNAWNSYQQLIAGRYGDQAEAQNAGWDLGRVSLDTQDPNSVRTYLLPEPIDQGRHLKATLCWYRHYQQDAIYTPAGMPMLVLELWAVDERNHLTERLDYSASPLDNLQHIDYQSPSQQRTALVVRTEFNDGLEDAFELYGLAYETGRENWQGDQNPADLNADGIVDVFDLDILLEAWEENADLDTSLHAWLVGDIDHDGMIGVGDFHQMAANWGNRSAWADPQ